MGKHTWEGWQTSAPAAPQPTSILYGANLRDYSKEKPQELPQPEVMQEETTSSTQSLLELAATAMRVKLQQNRKALQEQGIQSASDKIKKLNEQQE